MPSAGTLQVPCVVPDEFAWLRSCAKSRHSQNGEDGIIAAIFERVGEKNRWAFECGAGNGVTYSNTLALAERGWRVIMVEQNGRQFRDMEHRHCSRGGVRLGLDIRIKRVKGVLDTWGEWSADRIIERAGAPADIDFFSLDIDGGEEEILRSFKGLRPRVLCVECVACTHLHLDSLLLMLAKLHYVVVSQTLCNIFAVDEVLAPLLKENQ